MSAFIPANDLESALEHAQKGEITIEAFFGQFISAQAVVLLDKPIPATGLWDNSITPLVVRTPAGFPALALFTCLERATELSKQCPGYEYALLVDTRWILRGTQTGVGLVINPGSSVGLHMPPSGLAEFKQAHTIDSPLAT